MNRSILSALGCPACRKPYLLEERSGTADSIEQAFLTCSACCVTIPVLNGFPIFQEQRLTPEWDTQEQLDLLFGKESDYVSFLHQKRSKPVYDLYAAFQPFNDSTQSIFPLISLLREIVKPGDFLLDLWCRTGWSGELLASLFPDQQVISVWESSSGLLGTKGFHYWLGSGKRRKNLDIVFHSPNLPLPFVDGTFAVVHGLDTLHRYQHVPLLSECMRVVQPDGVIVFPHNHLTNTEPEPYFDRGEDQLHGLAYREYFSRLLKGTGKKAFVLSEKTLFDSGDEFVLTDQAETDHYNACILITDQKFDGHAIPRFTKTADRYRDAQVIVNPLWRHNWATGESVPAPEVMDDGGATLFFRHPMYEQRLNRYAPAQLEETDRLVVYWGLRQRTVWEIADKIHLDAAGTFQRLMELERREIVQVQNVSPAMARLQSFYSTQRLASDPKEETLNHLWTTSAHRFTERPLLIWPEDDSLFSYADADTIVRMAASLLKEQGVKAGDRILISASAHPEFFFAFWAGVLCGAVLVPVDPLIKPHTLLNVLEQVHPRLVLTIEHTEPLANQNVMYFAVKEDSPKYAGSFSEKLASFEPCSSFPDAQPEQPAVILFTSGSTGYPKGILLSHGALFRSSKIVDEAYGWRSEDRFVGGGSFHTMSGLRNPCITILHSGGSVVIPGNSDLQNPISILSLCIKYDVTILNVTPAFLSYWEHAAQKSKYFQTHKLRMVLSTGTSLQPAHRNIFETQFQCPVYDYYGLTETSGACILETPDLHDVQQKGIGKPYGCASKICADGELSIYTDNIMLGYINDPEATSQRIRDGWFLTGDVAQISGDGCIQLIGRKDRMLKDKNGEMLYPEQIESLIRSTGKIADVHVTAYRDPHLVEHIAALIQFHDSMDDPGAQLTLLREILIARMPAAQVPSLLVPVKHLPKGAAGKISREDVESILKSK